MARPRPTNGHQAQPEPTSAPEQTAPQDDGAAEAPLTSAPVEAAAPQDEPGPEDFERHTSARLIEEHARDLALREDVARRLKNRAAVIARRALDAAAKRGEKNPVVEIAGRRFFPRARPVKEGGGVGLSEERATRAVVALE